MVATTLRLRKLARAENFFRMAAQALNCPNCGAAASSEATRCEHCNSRLATVACPACFGMIFRGAKFCSHCGAKAHRTVVAAKQIRRCPRCQANMNATMIGPTDLRECPRCEGIWADAEALHQICTDRERQAAVLGNAMTLDDPGLTRLEPVRYVPCPVCRKLMNRVNFARCSNVVVDVCKTHGTWFDKEELRRIVEFIRAGGLDKARRKEIEELERQRRELTAAQLTIPSGHPIAYAPSRFDSPESIIGFAAEALVNSFFD
jgi:Zn-finger nucleic acid-binding protein